MDFLFIEGGIKNTVVPSRDWRREHRQIRHIDRLAPHVVFLLSIRSTLKLVWDRGENEEASSMKLGFILVFVPTISV